MRRIFLTLIAVSVSVQNLYGFWPFDWWAKEPLPAYALEHPQMDGVNVYGVGSAKTFLEAKAKALNDIATQVQSDVRSITSVQKNSSEGQTEVNQQITVLTKRSIDNFEILDESHANGLTYLLILHKRTTP